MHRFGTFAVVSFLAVALGASSMATAADATPEAARAKAAIDWNLPHEFEAAREAAKKQKRLLIIKGVSFGIDHAGAQCATKGKW